MIVVCRANVAVAPIIMAEQFEEGEAFTAYQPLVLDNGMKIT